MHLPYLPNFASADRQLYAQSIEALIRHITNAHRLGVEYVVLHPGNRGTTDSDTACERIAGAINRALEKTGPSAGTMVLLENAAGQGTEIGGSFTHLQKIIRGTTSKDRLGICLDTAHAFAAGYDVSHAAGLEKTLETLDRLIGINRLHLLHLNDSKSPLGSRVDRHWHIGRGHIGKEGFRCIVNHPALADLPGVMETPKKTDQDDHANMKTITGLVKQ